VRLKARFPTAKGSFGHRLLISVYIPSSVTTANPTSCGREREICVAIEWELIIIINGGQGHLRGYGHQRLSALGSRPTYSLQMVSWCTIKVHYGQSSTSVFEADIFTQSLQAVPVFEFTHCFSLSMVSRRAVKVLPVFYSAYFTQRPVPPFSSSSPIALIHSG
jgi:hypothetical protein